MRRVYLSPHFDDVVLSCGGIIWEQVQSGETVEIWTVCAGAPQPGAPLSPFAEKLHARWQTGPEAVLERQREDEAAVRRLGAVPHYWNLPDCIYRTLPDGTWLIQGEEDLWQAVHAQEQGLVLRLCDWLSGGLRPGDLLVSPLTMGNHVDHNLVRPAAACVAERLSSGPHANMLQYYADYPYSALPGSDLEKFIGPDWQKECYNVSGPGLSAWKEAVASYTSQISTFWGGLSEMETAIEAYWKSGGGTCLWKPL